MEFRVPLARDGKGRLVAPDEARRGGAYACPACGVALSLHAGEKKRRHFHHLAGACSSETALHAAAKALVAARVAAWATGEGASPVFVRRCADASCDATCRQPIPRKVGGAIVEARLPSGRVADVGLTARAAPAIVVAAIEVHVTHAVDDDKSLAMGVPWIEVDAARVCEARGMVLAPERDRFVPWLCAAHAIEQGRDRGRATKDAREDRRRRAELVRRLPFDLAAFPAFRVARVTRCENGHDALDLAWDGEPWPRPPCVVAVADDHDTVFRSGVSGVASGGRARVLAFRRRYVCVCARCGGRLMADDRASALM